MALDPMARRAEGVSQLTQSEMDGSVGHDGKGWNLPTASAGNPGPTSDLRGVEPNTGKSEGSNVSDPEMTQTFGSEVPRGPEFMSPDSSGMASTHETGDGWQTTDSVAKNSMALNVPPDSFAAMGEDYPGNGGNDGWS